MSSRYKNLVMAGFSDGDLSQDAWKQLQSLTEKTTLTSREGDDFAKALSAADAVVLRLGARFDSQMMSQSPNLKYIGMYGTGYGRIETAEAARRSIVVTNVPDYSTEGVAELAVAIILNHLRDLPRALKQTAANNYSDSDFMGRELASQTVGVVGLGNIGRRFASLVAEGFGSRVVYWSRSRRPNLEGPHLEYVDLPTLFSTADVISLHVALAKDTDKLIGSELLSRMKDGALLVNLSPMELIDFDALCQKLATNTIFLALDHTDELSAEQLKRLEANPAHCRLYPPIGYLTSESSARKEQILVKNVSAALSGSPQNQVN